jgi:GTP cyclohydrolase I
LFRRSYLQLPPYLDKRLKDSDTEGKLKKMAGAVQTLLECIGEDVSREGLMATPERYAKALLFFTRGYTQCMTELINGAIFEENHDEMIIVRDIEIFSLCEHHLVPFTGKVSAAEASYK